MIKAQNSKRYDLEERTFKFTKRVIEFCKKLPRTVENIELIRQGVRAIVVRLEQIILKQMKR